MFVERDLDLRTLQILDDEVWVEDLGFYLHLERFFFHRAAQRDQFRKHRLFPFGQEGIDLRGEFARLAEQVGLVEGEQFVLAH